MKKSNNKSAFTMVEILISIAIFSVILFVSVKVFDFTFLNMNNDKKLLQTFYGNVTIYTDSTGKKLRLEDKISPVIIDISKDYSTFKDMPNGDYIVKNSTLIKIDKIDPSKNEVKKVLFLN